MQLIIVTAILAALTTVTVAAPTNSTAAELEKRYTLRCNGPNNIGIRDRSDAISKIRENQGDTCHNGKCCATWGFQTKLVHVGEAYITLRAEGPEWSPACDDMTGVQSGAQVVSSECGDHGGSGPSLWNNHLVIHIADTWV